MRLVAGEACGASAASHSRGAFRPSFAGNLLALQPEGAGNAGRPMRPIATCAGGSGRSAHVLSGHTGITRHSPRDGLRLYVISPAIGFLATVACGTDRKLDTSTEVSGPHDFAIRFRHPRQGRPPRPPHPRPAPMTLRNAPPGGTGCDGYRPVFTSDKQNYFCERGLTFQF